MVSKKPYPLEQSPLFSLRSRARLCALLNVARSDLSNLRSDDSYRLFNKTSNGKTRLIEEPRGRLKRVHKRVHVLLARTKYSDWCFSGVRRRSYVDNARRHAGAKHLLVCDIHGFYQSTRKKYVFGFFRDRMKQPDDIAWLLADILTFRDHLPTGSSSSPLLAFRAYEGMFETLRKVAEDADTEFSLYVDDMSFSSERPLPAGLVRDVSQVVSSYGLELKKSKTRIYGPGRWKKITGVALSPDGSVAVPNRWRHEIHKLSEALSREGLAPKAVKRLYGLLCAAQQIDPTFGENLKHHVRQIMKSGICS